MARHSGAITSPSVLHPEERGWAINLQIDKLTCDLMQCTRDQSISRGSETLLFPAYHLLALLTFDWVGTSAPLHTVLGLIQESAPPLRRHRQKCDEPSDYLASAASVVLPR